MDEEAERIQRGPFLTGRLLIATPTLGDPNFDRTVVLLVDHDESGALGVVINRPSEIEVASILPDWQPYSAKPQVVFHGGPVGVDSALAIGALLPRYSDSETSEPLGFRRVMGRHGLVDLDATPLEVASVISNMRVFAGYAGWESEQLEGEIGAGSWFVVDSAVDDPFHPEPTRLWQEVLRRQGGSLALVATYPEDPTLN